MVGIGYIKHSCGRSMHGNEFHDKWQKVLLIAQAAYFLQTLVFEICKIIIFEDKHKL